MSSFLKFWFRSPRTHAFEIALFVLVLATIFLARRYFLAGMSPVDGGYQSYAMLWPISLHEFPGIDFIPYLGLAISYVLTPFHVLFGGDFFSALAAAELMTLCAAFSLVASTCVLFGFGARAFTFLAFGIVLWAVGLSGLVYGIRGMEFIVAGNSLLILRESLSWLAFLVLAFWAARVRRRVTDTDEADDRLVLPPILAPVLAGLAPFWSNASGVATCIALLLVWGLAMLMQPAGGGSRLRAFLLGGAAFVGTFAVALFVVTGGAPWFYLQQNFLGIADYQFWYFAPYSAETRLFTLPDLLRAVAFPFGWPSLLGWAGAVLAVGANARRFGTADLRCLGVVFILLAHLGSGAISQLGGHTAGRYMLVFYSVSLLFGIAQLGHIVLPQLNRRLGLPTGVLSGLGRLAALGGILALAAAILFQSYREFNGRDRVFFAPLGLYLDAAYADQLAALADLRDVPAISARPASERLFSGYLSAAEVVLEARPATRFGSAIHVLGDAARAEYLADFAAVDYPLVALSSPAGEFGYWHDWHLRANWYLYAAVLERYDPAFRTRYMMFLQPRREPLVPPQDLPALRCEIVATGPNTTDLRITDDSRQGDAHFGSDWLIDATLDQTSGLAPRRFPERLLPLLGTRGMLVVRDQSSTFLAKDFGANPPPPALVSPDGGMLSGRPLGPGQRTLPAEHRFGAPSSITLTALPEARGTLAVESCTLTPMRPNPFADVQGSFPDITAFDPSARLAG